MQKRLGRVLTSIREHTCVSYAKIATMGGFCNIDHIIVKATSHDDFPLPDKYVHHLLNIFSLSPSSHSTFALSFARRFRRTSSWRVALKCLLLLHRLLRTLSNDSPVWAEMLWTRTNGLLSLHPCNFKDCSSLAAEDYTAYVTSYARLLDEALDCISINVIQEKRRVARQEDSFDEEDNTAQLKIKDLERIIEILPQLQSLLDRAIDCWPTGAASRSFLVHSAMKHIVRDSFTCYAAFRGENAKVLDNLSQLPFRSSLQAFGIYKKAALQAHQLSGYHQWCKSMGYCEAYEYPSIDLIPDANICEMETILVGMWQLTDQSSSSNVSIETSEERSLSSFTESDGDKEAKETKTDNKKAEMESLIQWEVENDSVGWEDLLEASISMDFRHDELIQGNQVNGWQMQVHNPYYVQTPNPFYHRSTIYHGSCPNTPLHPLVL